MKTSRYIYALFAATLSVCIYTGCIAPAPRPPKPPVEPTPANQTLVITIVDEATHQPVVGVVTLDENPNPIAKDTDGNGRVEFNVAPGPRGLQACADEHVCQRFEGIDNSLNAGGSQPRYFTAPLKTAHVDPSQFSLAQLAAIRGAMWPRASVCPEPLRLPLGNRPNELDNIIATPYFDNYAPDQQEAIARCFKAVGWTHVVVGGLVDSWAYHGQYIGHDYTTPEAFERFLDQLQWFWDHGLAPVVFIHEDGASYDATAAMARRLIQGNARAQKLIRIVVMPGWEPAKYEWSSCTWARYIGLAREVLPKALNLLHTVSDVDAPVGTDSLCNDDDKNWNPRGNGAGWERVISAGLHGWLIQNGPYAGGPSTDPTRSKEFAAQFQAAGDGATYHGAAWHFAGNAGWPTYSAWGQGIPICLYNAEVTAYEAYWYNRPSDADRNAYGDLAVNSGACGYLDGGSIPVPVRR